MTIRVLVADDQSMVRAGFRMLLAGEADIEVVAEASNGLEAVEKAARFHPTVVLMDIRMPELDGLEATRRILAADQHARVLIQTTIDPDQYVKSLDIDAVPAPYRNLLTPASDPRLLTAYADCMHPEQPGSGPIAAGRPAHLALHSRQPPPAPPGDPWRHHVYDTPGRFAQSGEAAC